MPVITKIVKFSQHIFVILILLGTLSALSLSSIQWIESDIKQTEIILNQDSQSENSEEKSEFELEETLLNSNNLEHTIKLCYSEIYFSQQNVLLIDGLSGHTTPPPKVC